MEKIRFDNKGMILRPEKTEPNKIYDSIETDSKNTDKEKVCEIIKNKEKVGIKIYEGSESFIENTKKSLMKSFNFKNIEFFKNEKIRNILSEMEKTNEKIFVWAGIQNIVINLNLGDSIIFINKNVGKEWGHPEAILFDFVGKIKDVDYEFNDIFKWGGRKSDWNNIVFLKNKKSFEISETQFELIVELTGSKYEKRGTSTGYYPNNLFIDGNKIDEFISIIREDL